MSSTDSSNSVDVLIIGAGISGIGMAVHLHQKCPDRRFTMLDQRDDIGGTWSLFQYPGIRSDSDMHTLGFEFEPWTEQKAIADGPSIMSYLRRIFDKYNLRDHAHFGQKVVSAHWSSEDALWTVHAQQNDGTMREYRANFLYMGTGYYDYDQGYDPEFTGREEFGGEIIHPQFWPKDYDRADKKIVVIGSGATAVTLVPNLADTAQHVTMLQRTPTWYAVQPSKDLMANVLRAYMPDEWAYAIVRKRNIFLQNWFFNRARTKPQKVAKMLMKRVKKALGHQPDDTTFTPPYNPWEQRLCLVPDGDMFTAMKEGRADIVTDHIAHFDEGGIHLKSGKYLEADTIVTATGLKLAMAGKVDFVIDGKKTDFADCFYYKGCMFSGVPNMTIVFGYLNASWTLKVDIVARFTCRILDHMAATNTHIARPTMAEPDAVKEEADLFEGFSSGYVQRSKDILPRQAEEMPWRLTQDYLFERKVLLEGELVDDALVFQSVKNKPESIEKPIAVAAA